jgi:hypothetical protein
LNLGYELCLEYTNRYGKIHACEPILLWLLQKQSINLPKLGLIEIPLVMPESYKKSDPVESYRQYYLAEKMKFATWKTAIPNWVN